jgi:hypothetical protein
MQRDVAAVEADIQRLLPLVPYWPPRFSGVKDALVHIDGVAQWREFTYTEFAGVEQERFRRYVNFNTVRHAFENGRFDMQVPGDDWQCRKSKPVTGLKTPTAKYATMNGMQPRCPAHFYCTNPPTTGAIEHDVQKLFTRIPAWRPSYPSLNAARDYVAESSRCIHFSYSYWHEIEPRRFRTIVNFSTAKRAFQLAKFEIYEGDVGEDESDGTDETAVEGAEVGERKMEVSMLLYGVSSGSGVTSLIETSGFSATTVFGDAIDSISIAIADTTADTTAGSISARLSEALSECASIVQEEAQASAMPSPETILPLELEVDEDPFKVRASYRQIHFESEFVHGCGFVLTILSIGPYRCPEA